MRRLLAASGLFIALTGATFVDQERAVLHGLDKITARVSKMEVPVGDTAQFGRLVIAVKACRARPPEEPPESAAFLEITDLGLRGAPPNQAFRGWMFASSPALSAMEHPTYDIWVAGCNSGEILAEDKRDLANKLPPLPPKRPGQ